MGFFLHLISFLFSLQDNVLLQCVQHHHLMQVFHFVNSTIDLSRAFIFLTNIGIFVVFLSGTVMPGKDKNQKEEENKGLFSKFRKSKKKSEQAMQHLLFFLMLWLFKYTAV